MTNNTSLHLLYCHRKQDDTTNGNCCTDTPRGTTTTTTGTIGTTTGTTIHERCGYSHLEEEGMQKNITVDRSSSTGQYSTSEAIGSRFQP